uniref:MAD2L1-binding protein n=1 Tax=Mus musculus TaxID=10090 RepID=Q9CY15_MOUSE|nr:unnamed protein product [Mus musculus]
MVASGEEDLSKLSLVVAQILIGFKKPEKTIALEVNFEIVFPPAKKLSILGEPFCPKNLGPGGFPGLVTQKNCCQFIWKLLKLFLSQRLKFLLPYKQLNHFYRKVPQPKDPPGKKVWFAPEARNRKCHQVLADLESVLIHLQNFFARTLFQKGLIFFEGNALSLKKFFELDLSRLVQFGVDQGLNTGVCLRRLFRAFFLADPFSELQTPPLMGTIVMVQGHRDCGEDWFQPKLNYRVPSRGHKLTVTLSCGRPSVPAMASEDYIWFQAPVTLKGFHE